MGASPNRLGEVQTKRSPSALRTMTGFLDAARTTSHIYHVSFVSECSCPPSNDKKKPPPRGANHRIGASSRSPTIRTEQTISTEISNFGPRSKLAVSRHAMPCPASNGLSACSPLAHLMTLADCTTGRRSAPHSGLSSHLSPLRLYDRQCIVLSPRNETFVPKYGRTRRETWRYAAPQCFAPSNSVTSYLFPRSLWLTVPTLFLGPFCKLPEAVAIFVTAHLPRSIRCVVCAYIFPVHGMVLCPFRRRGDVGLFLRTCRNASR
ncbi:hypothetical protein LY76DRAFT_240516 [Colletotrichum caudatum]|nr:hypothetical protein LY76DRAFT_240516 [Colletotrichum caudatum]